MLIISLTCAQEFYRPIVTPFELELALVRYMPLPPLDLLCRNACFIGSHERHNVHRSREWTGDYITDFTKLLPGLRTDDFTYDEVSRWRCFSFGK